MQQRSRTDQLADALRRRIEEGTFPIGSKMPSEQAIATDFEVSRTVVREAVSRLKSDGLLETRRGAATRVRAPTRPTANLSIPRSIDGLLGFLEVRRSIEAEMAALAARRRDAAQCHALEMALLAIDHATVRGGDGVQEDLDFHLAIGRATANAYWSQFVRLFAPQMRLAIGVTRANEARRLDFCAAVAAEHHSIYVAILDANADDAREAVHRHLVNAAERITGADSDFWRQEGRDLVAAWDRQQLSTRED